jgi:RimJ/RimL family protein N-acetyltransferase
VAQFETEMSDSPEGAVAPVAPNQIGGELAPGPNGSAMKSRQSTVPHTQRAHGPSSPGPSGPPATEPHVPATEPHVPTIQAHVPTGSMRSAQHTPAGQPHPPAQRFASFPGGVFVGERFPELTVSTPRLHVRPHMSADADRVTEIFGDRLTQRWLPLSAEYGPIDGAAWCGEMAAERRGLGQGDHYAIVRREDERVIGCLWTKRTDWPARSTEVSFAVAAEARGFGFAAEAVDGLAIELMMRHDFARIEMRVAPGNTASRRVAEKAGFHYEGLLRNAGYVHSGRVDLEVWSLVGADVR